MEELIFCDRCKGSGIDEHAHLIDVEGNHGRWETESQPGKCRKCEGSGILKKIISIIYEPFKPGKLK